MIADVYFTPDDDRPSGDGTESDFLNLFGPLVSRFYRNLWWIGSGGYVFWNLTEDELLSDDDREYQTFRDGMLVPGVDFVAEAHRLTDFNLDIAVVSDEAAMREDRVKQFDIGTGYPISLPNGCCLAFCNLDGAYWSILHTPDPVIEQQLPAWRHHQRRAAKPIG